MLTRREFLWATAALAATTTGHAWSAEPRRILLGQVLPVGGADLDAAARGALLGAEEAARTAELLGARLELRTGDAAALIDQGVLALIGDLDAPAETRGVPLLIIRTPGDVTEAEPLQPHVFHVASSLSDRRAALARYGKGGGAEIADWHPSLKRFGAEQLNQRYIQRFGTPMEPLAWASWMAVKAAAEAALRGASSPAELARRLMTLGFDGHKGIRLRFRPEDHHLRQPLYVVSGDRVLAEIPTEEDQE
jgi:hypothetical protein